MEVKAHLFYVEDDESLGFVTRDNLELQGYQITHCSDGQQALDLVKNQDFDLCILDVMLPEVDGFTIAEEIRKKDQEVPIIFLTAKSLKEDKIHGLKLGADDYLTKPFSIEELILKIEIFLRRSKINQPKVVNQGIFQIGEFTFEHRNLLLRLQEEERKLTQKEADLLKYLAENKGNANKNQAYHLKLISQLNSSSHGNRNPFYFLWEAMVEAFR